MVGMVGWNLRMFRLGIFSDVFLQKYRDFSALLETSLPFIQLVSFLAILFTMRTSFVPVLAVASQAHAQAVPPSPCLVTNYTAIPAAVSNCTSIVLRDIAVPGGSKAIDLTGLQANSVVTFAGKTTFGYTNSSTFEPIVISGKNVTIKGEKGSVIDGNGNIYWDGLGSNGGVNKFVFAPSIDILDLTKFQGQINSSSSRK